jgi:hypothetical protein
MEESRRDLLKLGLAGAAAPLCGAREGESRTISVALVQFESVPEQVEHNTREVERLTEQAVSAGTRWVVFHEGTLCDYTPNLKELAQTVPDGKSVRRLENLARWLPRRCNCWRPTRLRTEMLEIPDRRFWSYRWGFYRLWSAEISPCRQLAVA